MFAQIEDEVSGKLQRYVIEPGAQLPPNIKKGAQIERGDLIANEVPREYRWVEVQYSDGKPPATRAEIKSTKPGAGWIQRGKESGERGAAAEAEAVKEADEALEAAKDAGEISHYARLPNKFGGGGFDDVLVEFTGEGKSIEATIRIREVKDYPNRHVPLSEFTAIYDNWAQNLERLKNNVAKALDGKAPAGFGHLSMHQLEAIEKRLAANEFAVEIRLGKTTHLGDTTHHAATTLPALEAKIGKKIDVRKIGEGDRGEPSVP